MGFRSILNCLQRGQSSIQTQRARRHRSACRLGSEFLEDRCTPAAMITIGDVTVVEGDDGTHNAEVQVHVTEPHGNSIAVNFATVSGSATAGSDFNAVSGRLTFKRSEMTKTILVPIRGDQVIESDETFSIRLTNAKGAKIATSLGQVTIADDEPRLTISDASAIEGNGGTSLMKFTVSLSHAFNLPISVDFATADGSALAGADYISKFGSLTFAENETSQEIEVEVIGDRTPEWDKSFSVNLASSDAVISDSQGTGTIWDNEPRITIYDAYNYGESTMTFYVYLAMPYDEPVTVDFATIDGTAIDGLDYAGDAGTLTIEAGSEMAMITFDVLDPTSVPDKYFYVQLSNPSTNATLMNEWATGYWYYDYGWWGGGDWGWYYGDGYYY